MCLITKVDTHVLVLGIEPTPLICSYVYQTSTYPNELLGDVYDCVTGVFILQIISLNYNLKNLTEGELPCINIKISKKEI